jgi:uncharacterized membrane protein
MTLLRYASLVLLAIWIGGLVALGVAGAPAIFAQLEAHDPIAGRTLAGLAFGAVFDRFQHLAWALGLLLLAIMGLRAAIGPRPRRFKLRLWTLAGMLAVSLIAALVVAPRINQLRDATPGAIASLTDDDPRKIEFGRLHGLSNGLMLATVLAGLGLMWAELRDVT